MKRALIRIVALAVLVTACGDGLDRMTDVRQQESLVGETITITKGQGQAGLAGAQLATEIRFRVKDSGGVPLGLVRGTIVVTAGGGSTNRTAFRTTSTGYGYFYWTLGASGPQSVTIALDGGSTSQIVTATVIPIGSELQISSGNNQVALPGATLPLPVRVRLVDPSGDPIPNATVRYDIVDGSGGTVVGGSSKKTTSEGRAINNWALGWGKSGQQLRVYVPGVDTVVFHGVANAAGMTISPVSGNNQSGPANTLLPNQLAVVVKDASNNVVPNAKGNFVVVLGGGSLSRTTFTTNSNGRAFVDWTLGPADIQMVDATVPVIGSATFNATIVNPCTSVAIGASVVVNSSTFCLEGGASGSDFTVVPVNVATSGTLNFSLTATNIVGTTAVPSPNVMAMRNLASLKTLQTLQAPTDDWEWNFREKQKRELDALPRPDYSRMPGGPDLAIVPGVPSVGATMTLNTAQASCSGAADRTGTVKHVSAHLIIIEDNANPINGFTAQDYTDIANKFESDVWNANVNNFGLPSDIDSNGGRVIALYTTAVNALTPAGSAGFVGGFFHARDLFPTVSCPTSNVGEMFYMLAPDPTGSVNTNVRTVADVKAKTVGTLSHEFQHLVNASRRLAIGAPFEEVWLNEGLSHIAEELVYYGVAGRTPGQNIGAAHIFASQANLDAFNTYMLSNFGRLLQWWINPEISGPFIQNDQLRTRGAIWSFLRYAADRKGGTHSTFWNTLAANAQNGMANLTTQIGTDPAPWFRDWAVGTYTDDLSGANPMPSWNWRDIRVNAYGVPYDLFVRNATANVALPVSIGNSGAASYIKFRVPASTTSNVTVTTPTATTNVVVFRRN